MVKRKSDRFNVSKYGGYLDTKENATGFFRVEKIDGKWWFIDPECHYFISTGSTGIVAGGSFARIDGELIDAVRETHLRLYDIHSGKIAPVDRKAITQ